MIERKCENEYELLETLITNLDKLTCFNCGKKLVEEINVSLKNDNPLGILYYEHGEDNYPREPDIPSTIYFECMECDNDRDTRIEHFIENDRISIDIDFFEHLLNCLANQKFIGEQNKNTREEHQSIIDNAWSTGMKLLILRRKMNDRTEEVMDFVDEILELLNYSIEKKSYDTKDFELKKNMYRKKLIKIFELNDQL